MDAAIDDMPLVAHVESDSSAHRAGVQIGDRVVSVNGTVPRDILEWMSLTDHDRVDLVVDRGGTRIDVLIHRHPGEAFGASVSSAVFDRVQTCDNHCEFCFIYQLPKGMRRSLYLKDDDYRLSFLFGNFTTLTRFTEADFERVVSERLSPLHVSVHACQPASRSEMLRNDRGGFSLRWMRLLSEQGIDVRAQIVLCPGVNDGAVLDDTLARLLEETPHIDSVAVVPLGLSRHNTEIRMRVHTTTEADNAITTVERWSAVWREITGRIVVRAADELYLLAGRAIPDAAHYGDFGMLEDGIGLVRAFVDSFEEVGSVRSAKKDGFFTAVDQTAYVRAANPAADTSLRPASHTTAVTLRRPARGGVAVLTGTCFAPELRRLLDGKGYDEVDVVAIENLHFGGNTSVAGLLTGADVDRELTRRSAQVRYLLPDVCLNEGRFLDDITISQLREVHDIEVVPTSGSHLRAVLDRCLTEVLDG